MIALAAGVVVFVFVCVVIGFTIGALAAVVRAMR